MNVLNRAPLEHSSEECRISSEPPFYKDKFSTTIVQRNLRLSKHNLIR